MAIVAGGYVGTQAIFAAIVGPPAIDAERPFDEQVEPFTSAEDGFTASFPSAPEVQSTVQEVGDFKIPITVYTAGMPTEQFAVSAAKMPAAVIELDLDAFLTNSFEGAASGAGAVLIEQVVHDARRSARDHRHDGGARCDACTHDGIA